MGLKGNACKVLCTKSGIDWKACKGDFSLNRTASSSLIGSLNTDRAVFCPAHLIRSHMLAGWELTFLKILLAHGISQHLENN